MTDNNCPSCGESEIWVPTFCNFGHCAHCFDSLSQDHDECGWNGVEHPSYSPCSTLPGLVHVSDHPEDCECDRLWAVYPEWDVCWGGSPPAPVARDLDRDSASRLADVKSAGLPLGRRFVARLLSSGGRPPTPPKKSKGVER